MAEYVDIPIDRIRCREQVRRTFREESIDGLAQSLKEVGMLHPVLVTPHEEEGYYLLVSGERRLRAARQAGEKVVPALVLRNLRGSITQIQLVENLQREDLNPVERALAIQAFMEQEGLSKAAAAARLGVPRTTLTDWLDVLQLEPRHQAALVDNFMGGDSPLTLSHVSEAQALAARLGSPGIAAVLLDAVLEHRLSKAETRQVSQMVRENANVSIEEAIAAVRAASAADGRPGASRRGRAAGAAGELAAGEAEAAAADGTGSSNAASRRAEGRDQLQLIVRTLDRMRRTLAALVGSALRHTTAEQRRYLLEYLHSMRRWIDDAIAFTREMDDPALAEERRKAMARAAKKAARRMRRKARKLALNGQAPGAAGRGAPSTAGTPPPPGGPA